MYMIIHRATSYNAEKRGGGRVGHPYLRRSPWGVGGRFFEKKPDLERSQSLVFSCIEDRVCNFQNLVEKIGKSPTLHVYTPFGVPKTDDFPGPRGRGELSRGNLIFEKIFPKDI